ncbi:hypothetical protein [Burkholderia sp. LMU1-1-1.1]
MSVPALCTEGGKESGIGPRTAKWLARGEKSAAAVRIASFWTENKIKY